MDIVLRKQTGGVRQYSSDARPQHGKTSKHPLLLDLWHMSAIFGRNTPVSEIPHTSFHPIFALLTRRVDTGA